MTTEQLEKANELTNKIKSTKNHVAQLKKANEEVEAAKALPTGIKVSYFINAAGKSFEFNPSWIGDETIRTEAVKCINDTKDKMIASLEAYIVVMEKELETL
jgi:hypothetical protein